jgi:hypothetical protein
LNLISCPNQHERERLAVSNSFRHFRCIVDFRNLNSVVVHTDDVLLNIQFSNQFPSATG